MVSPAQQEVADSLKSKLQHLGVTEQDATVKSQLLKTKFCKKIEIHASVIKVKVEWMSYAAEGVSEKALLNKNSPLTHPIDIRELGSDNG